MAYLDTIVRKGTEYEIRDTDAQNKITQITDNMIAVSDIDPTLSISGTAAEAKATGDAVNGLRSAITAIDDETGYPLPFSLALGGLSSDGTIYTETSRATWTDYKKLPEPALFAVDSGYGGYVCTYENDKSTVINWVAVNSSTPYYIPENTYFRIGIRKVPESTISDLSEVATKCHIIKNQYRLLDSTMDVNAVLTDGTYRTTGIPANWPVSHDKTSGLYGFLYANKSGSSVYQTVIDYRQNVYLRAYGGVSEGWSEWTQYAKYSEISAAIDALDVSKRVPIEMTPNSYIKLNVTTADINNPVSISGIQYAVLDCISSDVFVINAKGGSASRAYGFLDASNNIIEVAADSATLSNKLLTVPYGAVKIVINDIGTNTSYKIENNPEIVNLIAQKLMFRTLIPVAKTARFEVNSTARTATINGYWGPTSSDGRFESLTNVSCTWADESSPTYVRFILYNTRKRTLIAISNYASAEVLNAVYQNPEDYVLVACVFISQGTIPYTSNCYTGHWFYDGVDVYAQAAYDVLASTDDLNTITETGTYINHNGTAPTNWPIRRGGSVGVYGVLEVYTYSDFTIQTVVDYRQNIYVRRKYDNAWSDWMQYPRYDEITSSKQVPALPAKIFKRVGCIGDSYTEGYISVGGSVSIRNDSAWPHFMEQLTGNTWTNFGVSGSSCKTWVDGGSYSKLTEVQKSGNKCQAYVIGLMINDSDTSAHAYVPVGTASDIGTTNNSYYAYYYRLIQAVHSVNPDAPIFCNTCPKTDSRYTAYNTAVRTIVSRCKSDGLPVYLCDLAGAAYFTTDYYKNEVFTSDLINGHYTGIGYELMAECYLRVLSDVVLDNIGSFQAIHAVDYDAV